MKHRGALIGCGFFAENHLNAWTREARAELAAVCDLDPDKAERSAARFGIPHAYTDAAAMLEAEKPDFVDIVTTVPSHRPLVELACRSGAKTVICQKPFAETQEDGAAMVAAAGAAGTKLIVHENFRWQRGFVELKRRIAAGQSGPALETRGRIHRPETPGMGVCAPWEYLRRHRRDAPRAVSADGPHAGH